MGLASDTKLERLPHSQQPAARRRSGRGQEAKRNKSRAQEPGSVQSQLANVRLQGRVDVPADGILEYCSTSTAASKTRSLPSLHPGRSPLRTASGALRLSDDEGSHARI